MDANHMEVGPVARGSFSPADIRRGMLLYAVTDRSWLRGRSLVDCVRAAIAGGATFVQLREKGRQLLPLCHAAGVPLVIDDDVEAARRSGADGVHVGQSDTACAAAREALGPDAIVGVSAHTVDEALAAQAAGADYLGVGALFGTSTKSDTVAVSLEDLARICAAVDIPVTAIGGVSARTLPSLAGTGAAGAAVVSAIFAAEDIEAATRELRRLAEGAVESR